MGRLAKYTRRTVLVASAAVAGGVAFGFYQAKRTLPNPLTPGDGAATLNPWVIVDGDGVTVVTPRAEMGQGIQSTLAALVAEEMDLDWGEVRTMHGPGAMAYYNGALLADRRFDKVPASGFAAAMEELAQAFPRTLSLQVTGGSTSVIDAYDKMRLAGAAAREVLKQAAAERLGIAVGDLRTEAGKVIAPDGSDLSYSELATAAATLTPPKDPPLKPRSEWKLLGRSLPRLDQPGKATGTAVYAMDVRLPDMAYATVRMSPRLGGDMISFDASAAEAMPGVEKVVDLGGGIAVIANNTWTAIQAAEAVDIEWGPAPYPETSAAMYDVLAASFDDKPNATLRDDGDVDSALAGSEVIVAEYRVPYLAHATMEPMNATALYTGEALEIWAGNQAPVMVRDLSAAAVDLPKKAVNVHTTLMGGGFGRRSDVDFTVLAAQVAKALPGRPVQTTWSREEDMRHDHFRPAAIGRFRATLKDGKPAALEGRMAAPSIIAQMMKKMTGFALSPSDQTITEGAYDQPYAIPNYRVAGHAADLAVPVGFWRSVGNSQNAFFHESFIDELAHAAGADPLTFRADLIRPAHPPSADLLDTVREMSGWTGQTPDGTGMGVAFTYSFGTAVAQVVEVRDSADGIRVTRAWIACDPGTALDPANIEAQMTSGMVYGLSAAMFGEITFADGEAEQTNFPDYEVLRMHTTPRFEVRVLENNTQMGGVGEPGTPPAAPALANALFDLTGTRARELPLSKSFDFMS